MRPEEETMPRLPDLDPANLDEESKRVYDAIVAGPRGIVQGPLRVWLNSPTLADRAQALGAFCRYGTSLEPRLSELAILVTGAFWRAGFEWHVHAPIAADTGLSAGVIEEIRRGATPEFVRDDERCVYAFAHALWTTHRVSAEIYAEAECVLGRRALVDLVGILGYYALISMTICAFEVPLPEGAKEPFA
jgi:4-carboxymuconolactone decarboxylase